MTADLPGPRDDALRLTEALHGLSIHVDDDDILGRYEARSIANYLLPVVDAIAEARAVARAQAELRAAADGARFCYWTAPVINGLYARAAELGQP